MTSHPTPTAQADLPPDLSISYLVAKSKNPAPDSADRYIDELGRRAEAAEAAANRSRASRAAGAVWQDIATAPKDGTIVLLLVDFTEHPLEDDIAKPLVTIGGNSFDNTGEDRWQFAGWSWVQDCFTDGEGTVIGWMPCPAAPGAPSAPERQTEVADGWVMVPREPTEAMLEAGAIYRRDVEVSGKNLRSSGLYEAMIAAAPSAPSREAEAPNWSVERHGNGWAIYRGRDMDHHGCNLGHLTECDDKLAAVLQQALNAWAVAPVGAQAVRSVREAGE